jgi:hypothetical protein
VRLQVVADQVGSKHTGDSRNAAKEGSRRGPSQRRTVDGVEMRAFGDKQELRRSWIETRIRARSRTGRRAAL